MAFLALLPSCGHTLPLWRRVRQWTVATRVVWHERHARGHTSTAGPVSRRRVEATGDVGAGNKEQRKRAPAWTSEETARLMQLRHDGSSWDIIRAALPRRSIPAIRSRTYDLNLATTRSNDWTPVEATKITEMRAQGRTYREIVEHLPGRTMGALVRYVHRRKERQQQAVQTPSTKRTRKRTTSAEREQVRHFKEDLK